MTSGQGLERCVGWLAVLSVAIIVILAGKPGFSNASRPPRGIANPVVALEVARNVDEVDAILGEAPSPDREAMRIKQYVDFGFIACYAGLYVALSLLFAKIPWGRWLAVSAAVCGVAAAVFDVLENLAILRILDARLNLTTQAMIDSIRRPSLIKWTLVFVAIALLSSFFLASRKWTMRTVGGLYAVAAALGLYGVHNNAFLVWAGIPVLAGMIGIAALFFRLR